MLSIQEQNKIQNLGISTQYIDAWGAPKTVDDESIRALLHAIELNTADKDTPAVIAPVYVWKEEQIKEIFINLSALNKKCWLQSPDKVTWKLENEFGQVQQGNLLSLVCSKENQTKHCSSLQELESEDGFNLILPMPLTLGYHQFQLDIPMLEEPIHSTIIIAPKQCYQPVAILEKKKMWGPSIQLYTLKSKKNWGIGDFGDLQYLIESLANLGADFVGLNPIHALFSHRPKDASPYSPSSRYWLNFIYLDIPKVYGYQLSDSAQKITSAKKFQQQLEQLRHTDNVEYTQVMSAKLEVLKAIYVEVFAPTAKEDAEFSVSLNTWHQQFKQFKTCHPKLHHHACFDAINDPQANHDGIQKIEDWAQFIEKYPDPSHKNVQTFIEKNALLVDFYCFVQWQTQLQLNNCFLLSKKLGMRLGLYRDLAVGVNHQSSDVWANHDLFCTDASIGAPPDVLNYQGQSWGLPPMRPQVLKQQAYQPLIELLRLNMQSCGALRIDHILGLMRLWWVPNGQPASKGSYVENPIDDFLGILALESIRNKCLIIGEDLGTIPESIKEKLATTGIFSYKVFFFNRANDGGFYSPKDYPEQSLASLCTHDMPTLKGYWHGLDISLSQSLGQLPDQALADRLNEERNEAKQQILNSMNWHGQLDDSISQNAQETVMDTNLNHAFHRHIAYTQSALLSLQLEDWMQMETPVNVPGTSYEYPNWQRKLDQDLETFFNNQTQTNLLKQISHIRKKL